MKIPDINANQQVTDDREISFENIFIITYRPIEMSSDNVKKMKLHYSQCPAGDLHTGELMNLVCVDANCTRRGLICPICRMNNHEEHQILPLKIFLDEVKKLFLDSEDSESLNNLSDYLRALDSSRKELITILKDAAEAVAQEFREIEKKINENYISVRRNVLAQSSISTKLPNFIDALSQGGQKNAFELQEQFQKYSELIKFENSKMVISDKAKKIVQDFSAVPKTMKTSINQQVSILKESFKEIISGKAKETKNIPAKLSPTSLTFDPECKSFELELAEDNKSVFPLGADEMGNMGLAYLKCDSGEQIKQVKFKIAANGSESMCIGMGIMEQDKQLAYIFDQPVVDRHFFARCTGDNHIYNDQEDDEEISITTDEFEYMEVDSIVTVTLNSEKNEILFEKKGSEKNKIVSISHLSEERKKKLNFFVALGESDQVEILSE